MVRKERRQDLVDSFSVQTTDRHLNQPVIVTMYKGRTPQSGPEVP